MFFTRSLTSKPILLIFRNIITLTVIDNSLINNTRKYNKDIMFNYCMLLSIYNAH